ncbi:unnamed protein product [Oncorhynchus mykiss]|uniref:Uncharacterized protein n=1 Tax=Oncorhynchus mykiss TaxID=8022 RepID=A0A060X6L7_ONCMY|nr:unnamed protein product [Oncorhynchus mykiss]
MFTDMDYELEEDKLGIPTVPGTISLKKDAQNLIGISIGGGRSTVPVFTLYRSLTTPLLLWRGLWRLVTRSQE